MGYLAPQLQLGTKSIQTQLNHDGILETNRPWRISAGCHCSCLSPRSPQERICGRNDAGRGKEVEEEEVDKKNLLTEIRNFIDEKLGFVEKEPEMDAREPRRRGSCGSMCRKRRG